MLNFIKCCGMGGSDLPTMADLKKCGIYSQYTTIYCSICFHSDKKSLGEPKKAKESEGTFRLT